MWLGRVFQIPSVQRVQHKTVFLVCFMQVGRGEVVFLILISIFMKMAPRFWIGHNSLTFVYQQVQPITFVLKNPGVTLPSAFFQMPPGQVTYQEVRKHLPQILPIQPLTIFMR